MTTRATKGAALLEAGKYSEAIEQFTLALGQNPNAPDYYIKRSTAYQRKNPPDYQAALQDAEFGVVAATKRARRELIAQAQLRRGIALFHLGRFKDAHVIFSVVEKLDEKEKMVGIWIAKCETKLNSLTGEEGPEATANTVVINPEVALPAASSTTAVFTASTSSKSAKDAPTQKPFAIQPTPADKVKHDWYQNQDKVYLTIMAKGVPKDKADIEIKEDSIYVSFPTADHKTYSFSLDPLFAKIVPAQSTTNITAHKIEIVLVKLEANSWSKLESDQAKDNITPEQIAERTTDSSSTAVENKVPLSNTPVAAVGPSYPTSSRSGPKNWDKLALEIDDEKEGGDDVNNFFKHLYKGADADTQRAMLKSYQESNGTVLSTNWSEVGAKKVETAPPDGMTAKKWGE